MSELWHTAQLGKEPDPDAVRFRSHIIDLHDQTGEMLGIQNHQTVKYPGRAFAAGMIVNSAIWYAIFMLGEVGIL